MNVGVVSAVITSVHQKSFNMAPLNSFSGNVPYKVVTVVLIVVPASIVVTVTCKGSGSNRRGLVIRL